MFSVISVHQSDQPRGSHRDVPCVSMLSTVDWIDDLSGSSREALAVVATWAPPWRCCLFSHDYRAPSIVEAVNRVPLDPWKKQVSHAEGLYDGKKLVSCSSASAEDVGLISETSIPHPCSINPDLEDLEDLVGRESSRPSTELRSPRGTHAVACNVGPNPHSH